MKKFFYECFYDETNIKLYFTNGLISFFVIVSMVTIPLEFFLKEPPVSLFLDWVVKAVVTFFFIEYILRIWSAPKSWKYIFSFEGIVDCLSVLPYFLYRLNFINSVAIWLGLRSLRLLKLLFVDEIHHSHLPIIQAEKKHGAIYFHPQEKLVYIARRSPYKFLFEIALVTSILSLFLVSLSFLPAGWPIFIAGSIAITLCSLMFVRAWINHHYDCIYVTTKRLILQDRDLFGSRVNEIHYEAITNVVPDTRGLFNICLRMGTLWVETGSHEDGVKFRHLRRPHKLVEIINQQRFPAKKTEK